MADLQQRVQAALGELVTAGTETGLQAAVYRHGELVADAASGVADPASGAPVTSGTLFFATSAAKAIATTLAHTLAERGELDYDLRLSDVWPAFADPPKDQITIRHVLMHMAGLPALPAGTTVPGLCDWDRMCAALAAETPWWEPGTRFGYHPLTFGFLLGEALRRLTGRTPGQLLSEVVTSPLGVADEVCFAVPPRLLPRVARRLPDAPAAPSPPPGSPLARAMPPALRDPAAFANRDDVLTADIVSVGTMSARGAARVLAALLGPVDGTRFVSPQRRDAMSRVAFTGPDEVMGFPTRWAFGYSPDRPGAAAAASSQAFGMIGANGSAVWAVPATGYAAAVMRNGPSPADLTAAARIATLLEES